MKFKLTITLLALLLWAGAAAAAEIEVRKHIIPAPDPYREPAGSRTPDGSFNLRDSAAPFHSAALADSFGLDPDGKLGGRYLDLNHAVYTAYRLAGPTETRAVVILMPGTWAGAMSLDRYARDLLRLSEREGFPGLEVWLLDRRSEQLEDHTGLAWAMTNPDGDTIGRLLQGVSDYYRPAFDPAGEPGKLYGRRFYPLSQDDVRFMANWGADVAIRDWRAVVIAAHRAIGNEVIETPGEEPRVVKKPGRWVFIGGHSLGGSLTTLYAAYDFDRRPGKTLTGASDVDGLILLEGGGMSPRETKKLAAEKYRQGVADYYTPKGKVYFDMNMLGIQYSPSTMTSVQIAAWAADVARGRESVFPMYSRPATVRLPHITNEALLGLAMDDDSAPFFIARVSFGHPTGKLGRQFRFKTATVPLDPGECPLVTPWWPGHVPMDKDFVYGWRNIDQGDEMCHSRQCQNDTPEVTDFYAFAHSVYRGPLQYEELPEYSRGPNDFAEWYFPPRLSMDSRYLGTTIAESDGTEFMNAVYLNEVSLPVISFVGDDSMGEYAVPKKDARHWVAGSLAQPASQVHNLRGYTHLDIPGATRNFQPDLPGFHDFNGPAAYSIKFIKQVTGKQVEGSR